MAKRVYFAFHYQDVIDFRANVVRKHNFAGGVEAAGYYDCSVWEEAKNTSPSALKRLINAELEYTSVTAVLIGSHTWARRWVRYEIMKSIERGNFVLGVHINAIKGKDQMCKALGPSPFDNLGLEVDATGSRARPTEWNGTEWIYSGELGSFEIRQQGAAERGKHLRLSYWPFPVYDWVNDFGFQNFNRWIS